MWVADTRQSSSGQDWSRGSGGTGATGRVDVGGPSNGAAGVVSPDAGSDVGRAPDQQARSKRRCPGTTAALLSGPHR